MRTVGVMLLEWPLEGLGLKKAIPADWKQYEDPTGRFTMHYPQQWSIQEPYAGTLKLELPSGAGVMFRLKEGPAAFEVGNESDIRQQAYDVLTGLSSLDQSVIILSQGAWFTPLAANYVKYQVNTNSTTRGGHKISWYGMEVLGPVDSDRSFWAIIFTPFTLPVAEIEACKLMLASVQVRSNTVLPEAASSPTRSPAIPETVTSTSTIAIVEWNWSLSETGSYVRVQGIAKNVSDRPVRSVEIHVVFRDANKKFLATAFTYCYINRLQPGDESTWSVLTRNPGGVKRVEIKNIGYQWTE